MKNQEDSAAQRAQEELAKMSTEVDRKEYDLQALELKVYHYEKYLQRQSHMEVEAHKLLAKFSPVKNLKDRRVTSVVEDNLTLRDELKEAFQENHDLERQIIKKNQMILELKEKMESMKVCYAEALHSLSPSVTE